MRNMQFRMQIRTASARFFRQLAAFLLVPVVVLAVTITEPGSAQNFPPGISADQFQQLQGRVPASQPAVPDLPTTQTMMPATPAVAPALPSRLERILSQRAGVDLHLFGYETLGSGRPVNVNQAGAIQDDYILGPGDEIVVSLRGQENSENRTLVNRDGQVVLPRLNPISAVGRTFLSFRKDVEAAVARSYVATTAFVSIGRVRQINVMVSGEVNNPGVRIVSSLASVTDALLLSGGIKRTGSLRSVHLQRGGRDFIIDLYSVISGNGRGGADMHLADGDRIIVPLLGPTIAISGLVRQPGIYELPARQRAISADSLIALAGGEEVRGLYRLSILRVDADGQTNLVNLSDRKGEVRDSEILFVQFAADSTVNRATLAGGTGLAGTFPITDATKLSTLLKAPGALGQSPYTLFGIIARKDKSTLLRTLTAFSPVAVLRNTQDLALQADDVVRIISVEEMRTLVAATTEFSDRRTADKDALHNPLATVREARSANGQAGNNTNGQGGNNAQGGNSANGQGGNNASGQGGGATSTARRGPAPRKRYCWGVPFLTRHKPGAVLRKLRAVVPLARWPVLWRRKWRGMPPRHSRGSQRPAPVSAPISKRTP